MGAFACALLIVLLIALAQRHGLLDMANLRGMDFAGKARESEPGRIVTGVMLAASFAGDSATRLIVAGLVALGLWRKGDGATTLWVIMTIVGGMLLNSGLKQIFAAPRPDLLPHLDIVNSYSFPSGHAAGTALLCGALAMMTRWRPAYGIAAAVVILIGVSRIWLGVHWPGDVLAGWVTGLGWLALCAVWLPARRRKQQGAA